MQAADIRKMVNKLHETPMTREALGKICEDWIGRDWLADEPETSVEDCFCDLCDYVREVCYRYGIPVPMDLNQMGGL